MTVLGIETSTRHCSVGTVDDDGRVTERFLSEPRVHSEKLLTLVQELFDDSGLVPQSIGAVAVSIGPGSFTGLRIGLSTAKGLACSLSCEVVAVPTFDGYAQALWEEGLRSCRVLVAVDARQGEYYTALYDYGADDWTTLRPVQIDSSGRIVDAMRADDVRIVLTDTPDIFHTNGSGSVDIRMVTSYCRGSVIADIGRKKIADGSRVELDTLEPYYLKTFVAKKSTRGGSTR